MRTLHQVALLAALWVPPFHTILADPWVETGDERTRHHLQVLADSGKLSQPLTTWPIMWSGIKQGLDQIRVEQLNEAELWSYRFLRHHIERAMRSNDFEIRARASSLPSSALNSFSDDMREGSEITGAFGINGENAAAKVVGSYVHDPVTGDQYRLDGSYLAVTWDNWVLGAGRLDRWWGPGWQASQILGNNARPPQTLFIRRKDTSSPRADYSKWLNSWDIDLFISRLNDKRYIKTPNLVGGRLTYKPVHFLELGLSSTEMRGGSLPEEEELTAAQATPASVRAKTTGSTAFAASKAGTTTLETTENNRMSGYDWRIGHSFYNLQVGAYQQKTRKETNGKNAETASLIGLEFSFTLAGSTNRFSFEQQDTRNGNQSIFDDGYYKSGYRIGRKTIASSIDSAAEALTLQGDHYLSNGQQFSWRLGSANLNEDNVALSEPAGPIYGPTAVELDYASITYKLPASDVTQLEAGLRYFSESLLFEEQEISSGGYLQLTFAF